MKIALVHDWLVNIAGAEKVLETIYEIYPGDIFTLVKDDNKLKEALFKTAQIKTSFLNNFPKATKVFRNFLLLFPFAIEQFDLSAYDVIISSSHAVAKGVLTNANQLHICYCHTPIRYAWDLYHQYLSGLSIPKKLIAKLILHYIRIWDSTTANRVDYFIANSKYVAKRIYKTYRRQATVIYPPVDVDKFHLCENKENFYLTVSRLVPYKRIDLIVKAFSKLKDKKLVVIGDGPEMEGIKKIATPNVEILRYQPFEVVKEYMQKAKAFIFAAEEDFGIAPVEAQACGTPVIAFGKGGAVETVIDGTTGILFKEQTTESLIEAIYKFEKMEDKFNLQVIRKHAEKFSKERFKREFKQFVDAKIEEFFK